jgi:hypothetical protein
MERSWSGTVVPTKPIDTQALGDLTALQAREGEHPGAIAWVTELPEDEVRRRLARGAGKRRVWRVFDEEWPGRDREELLAERGSMTAAAAREENYAAEVAKITGLSEEMVRARVAEARPGKRMRGAFAVEWPPGIAMRGRMTVEDARLISFLEDAIASVTGLSGDVVEGRLSNADPTTLVHDVFRGEWPEQYLYVPEGGRPETDEDAWYGRLRCSEVRGANRAARIAKDMGLSEDRVRRRLDAVPGQRLVRNVFAAEWPKNADERADVRPNGKAKGVGDVAESGRQIEDAKQAARQPAVVGSPLDSVRLGQGGDEHRTLQDRIARLGQVRGFRVETDKPRDAGFRPDVVWFKSAGDKPWHVFEIERGPHGARAKSLQSLQHAYENHQAEITLLVHRARVDAVREMVSAGIAHRLNLRAIEDCLACGEDALRLAKVLALDVGERR